MRWIIPILVVAVPARAAEVCVEEAVAWCCHPLCDVPVPTTSSGFSTAGPPSCGTYGEFTISSSSVDPYVSEGDLPGPFGALYLWLTTASGGYGFSASDVTVSGDLPLWQFTPRHAAVSLDTTTPPLATTWAFSTACVEEAPVLLADFVVVIPPTSTEPATWGRVKALWR
jgi:hypothetical protein